MLFRSEKHFADDGTLECLEICDQWNVVRNGIKGGWKYNPEARNTTFQALPEANLIDPANWIIRIVPRHVNRIGIIKFLRSNLSQKDWDGFIEQYGIPAWLIFGPPNVPLNKIADYEAAAEKIARGGSGYLPNGSTAMAADSPRGSSPFKEHLDYWQKQLILVGTGGLLTMLAESGSGTLAGAAHTDTFEQIARAEARKISSIMQRQLDRQILNNIWPGSPRLAYWELAANEETDTGALIDQVLKLSQAGYQMSAEELSEKTGYSLTLKPSVGSGLSIGNVERGVEPQDVESAGEQPPEGEDAEMSNRAPGIVDHTFQEAVYKAAAMDLQPVRRRLERILQIDDPEILQTRLRALQREIESGQLLRDINADPASAKPMELLLAHSMQQGITKEKTHESKS